MCNEYLHKEYALCYEQLRFYDERQDNILKYFFSLTSAVGTAQFAVFKFFQGPSKAFFALQVILSIIVFIATLLLYLTMLQNRIYFVYTARQLNALRGYLLSTEASDFKNNQLYISTNVAAFKLSSVHTFQLIGSALTSSLFSGLLCYSTYPILGVAPSVGMAIFVFILVAILETVGGVYYLWTTGKKTADEAVHGYS